MKRVLLDEVLMIRSEAFLIVHLDTYAMKRLRIFILIFIYGSLAAHAQKPEKIYSVARVAKSHSYYVSQAALWWQEIEKNGKNEKAWYNYYKANRYAKMTSGGSESWLEESSFLKEPDAISDLITKAIPGTYTYYIIQKRGYPADKDRFEALQKAYEIDPDNPDTYSGFVIYYDAKMNRDQRAEFNKKWFQSNDFSPGLMNYSYNVLMSMEKGGAILTFGDNDTFPIWMLQDALGIRTDVTVLNGNLLTNTEYRQKLFKTLNIPAYTEGNEDDPADESSNAIMRHIIENKPDDLSLYISTPAWKQFTEYDDELYIVGLVFSYSKENIDNIALLRKNFEKNFALDYIVHQFSFDISQDIVTRINVNYLPGIIKLYQHYKLSGEEEKANRYKELGMLIADKGGPYWKDKAEEIFE
jgi:hypothetical protein